MRIPQALLRRAVPVCGAAGVVVSLPGLFLPFLSDDWAHLAAVGNGPRPVSTYGDFRPLFMASVWLDRRLFGDGAAGFHATQALLAGLAAALVARLVDRLTGDRSIALMSGLLFALHPYHVETAAWISSRSDPLYSVLGLMAILAYERWRGRGAAGVPLMALALVEASLLAKESALVIPGVLLALTAIDPARRARRREWIGGILPLVLLAALHIALRWVVLGGPGRTLLEGAPRSRLFNALGFGVAALLPLSPERLMASPSSCAVLATLLLAALVTAALRGRGVPAVAIAAGGLFLVLLIPDVVGFQRRYFFLPAAASACVLATLLRAAPRRFAVVAATALALGWPAAALGEWWGWREAARASDALVEGLARVSAMPAVREIVVANMPLRVAGASVGGDMSAALRLSGARSVPVRAMTWVSYPRAGTRALDEPLPPAHEEPASPVEARLVVGEGPYWKLAGPRPRTGEEVTWPGYGVVTRDGETTTVTMDRAPERGRAVVAWSAGRVIPLALP